MRTIMIGFALLFSISEVVAGDGPWKHDFELKPQVIHSDDFDQFSPAVRYTVGTRYDYVPNRGVKSFGSVRSEGLLALHKRAHSENLFAELLGGVIWNTYKSAPDVRPEILEGNPGPPASNPGRNWGRFDFGGKVRFETDQPLENYNLTYGPTIGYVHDKDHCLWPLIPSLVLDYHRVEVLYSRDLNLLGITDDSYFRFGAVASWKYRLGSVLAPESKFLSPIGLHGDLRYYVAHDIPTGAGGTALQESIYLAGDVSYNLTDLNVKWLREVFVRVAHGRIPPAQGNQTVVSVGFVLGWK